MKGSSSPNDTPKTRKKLRKRPFFDSADRHEKLYGRSGLYASAQGRHETGGVLSLFSRLSFDISIENSVQRWSSDFQGLFRVKIRKMAQGSDDLSTLPLTGIGLLTIGFLALLSRLRSLQLTHPNQSEATHDNEFESKSIKAQLEKTRALSYIFFVYIHCIIGSAEALPILCVSDFCERERERERETPVTSLISRWNREWSCIWLPRRRVDPTRQRVLTRIWACRALELRSACKDKELGAWALDWAAGIEQQGRVIDEWRWGSESFAFAGQTAVDHSAAFRWHASSKKNRPS